MRSICQMMGMAAATSLLAALSQGAWAADYPTLDTSVSFQGDANGGRSSSLDVASDLNRWWALSGSVGRSRLAEEGEDFTGDSAEGALQLHNDSFGIRADYNTWQDSGNYQEHASNVMLSYKQGGFDADLIGDWRSFQIDYTLTLLGQSFNRHFDFNGRGLGAQIGWSGEHWGASARYVSYDYGDDLDQLKELAALPNLSRFPRIDLLVSSAVTQSRGALDQDLSGGIDYTFTSAMLRLNLSHVTDAIEGHATNSASLDYHQQFGGHLYGDLIGGYSHSEDDLSGAFGGVTLGYGW